MKTKLKMAFAATIMGLLPGAVAADSTNFMIVNGVPYSETSEVPWQVALVYGPSATRDQFCGGSIIADTWVLTAAHCVDNWYIAGNADNVDILADTLQISTGGTRVEVAKIHVHPGWGTTSDAYDFDAALLKLKEPLTVGAAVALADDDTPLPDDFGLRVSGWGATSENGSASNELLYVDVPVYNQMTCVDDYNGAITENMICAGFLAGGSDSCQGDSGGPLVTIEANLADTRLAGIVSWGYGCARPRKPGVYTRVSVIHDWVETTMQTN